MLIGTNLTYTKEYNLRIVHETIRLHGPLSRADIARRTELTVQTVSNLVRQLVDLNLVREDGRRQEGRGAPSVTLSLNANGGFAVGLDLDRDHLTGVLVDLTGQVRQRVGMDLHFPSPEDALDKLTRVVHELVERHNLAMDQLWGVGIGIPGPMHQDPDGRDTYVMNPKAFPGWHNVPIADALKERLNLPVFIENNASAAAMGERQYGSGQEFDTFFYIYFGSGLGGGLVLRGQPFDGFTGNSGEIGYLPTQNLSNGPVDDRPHVGLHFYLPRLFERLQSDGLDVSRPEDLKQLFDDGNPRLMRWIEEGAEHLTMLSLAVEYLIDPEAIFFGGRLPDNVLEELMKRVGALLPDRRITGKVAGPQQLLARAGVDAAALGVATLPFYEFAAPAPQVLLKQGDASGAARLTPPRSAAG